MHALRTAPFERFFNFKPDINTLIQSLINKWKQNSVKVVLELNLFGLGTISLQPRPKIKYYASNGIQGPL